jgi:outer membrane protein OmpA-like peptidoglycan-associated protein
MRLLCYADQMTYNMDKYVNGCEDREGRIEYILALIRDEKIACLHVPFNYEIDPEYKQALGPKEIDLSYLFPKKKEKVAEEPEEPVQGATSKIVEVINPRWEHKKKDEDKNEKSPDIASVGDTVILIADIRNCPEGAEVVFDIYDMSVKPAKKIDSAKGKHNKGLGKGEWVVADKENKGEELKLAFEATARSKTSKKKEIQLLTKFTCDFVEIPDILFNHGSAIPCIDNEGVLIGALCAAFVFAKNNTNREVVLFGHADTSGDSAFNYDLSGWRADGIKALCDNDSDAFLDVVDLASKIEDYQTILKSLAQGYGWPTDPGEIDNIANEKTKSAVKAFQEEYNRKFNANLATDGAIGPNTWIAFFRVIRSLVDNVVKKECGEVPTLTYGYSGKGLYPCGESFPVDAAQKDNYKSKENRRVEIVFFEKGKCPTLEEPADKNKVKKTEAAVYDDKITVKKLVPVDKSSGVVSTDDGGMIFYATGRNEYFKVDEAAIDALRTHVEDVNTVAAEVAELRKLFEGGGDNDANLKKAKELEEKVIKRFKNISVKPASVIQELLVIKDNSKWGTLKKRVYIEPDAIENGTVKGEWKKATDTTVKDEIRKWYNKKPDKMKEDFKAKMKGVLWQSEAIDTKWPWDWKIPKPEDKSIETKAGYFEVKTDAQFLRFIAGVAVDTEFDLKKMSVKLAAHGDVSYSLAEGTVTGSWSLPDKDGADMFSLFNLNEKGHGAIIENGKECRLRITFEANGKAFAGAAVTASVALPSIDLSHNDSKSSWSEQYRKANQRTGYAEAGVDVFAGASGEGKITAKGEWSPDKKTKFESLALIQAVAAGSAGIGAGAKIQIGYKDGNFRLEMAAQVVAGIGGKLGTAFEIGIDAGFNLLAHIFYSVNYYYVKDVMGGAFDAFRDYAFAQFKETGKLTGLAAQKAITELSDFSGWLKDKSGYHIDQVSKGFMDLKVVLRSNVNDILKLQNSPPETLGGQVLRTIMLTTESEDFDAIIRVLESAKSVHELKWIIRCIVDYKKDDPDGKLLEEGIKRLLVFGNDREDLEKSYQIFNRNIKFILNKNGIRNA